MTESEGNVVETENVSSTEKVKVIHFETILEYPEDMDNEDILDRFSDKILDEASTVTSDSICIKTRLDVERLKTRRFDKNDLNNLIYNVVIQILQPLETSGRYKGNSHHLTQRICESLSNTMIVKNAAKLTD